MRPSPRRPYGCWVPVDNRPGRRRGRVLVRRLALPAAACILAASIGAQSYAGAGKKGVKHPNAGNYRGPLTQIAPPYTGELTLEVLKPEAERRKSKVLLGTVRATLTCTEASGQTSSGVYEEDLDGGAKIDNAGSFFESGSDVTIHPTGREELTFELRGKFIRKRVAKGWVEIGYTQDFSLVAPCYQVFATSGRLPFRVTQSP
jgi:hypothetical protein